MNCSFSVLDANQVEISIRELPASGFLPGDVRFSTGIG
jgi:hypothetical protein